ncbi:MAG: tyrosine-type recombinase/integrase [Planctomycetaceae bacterium]|nr:tyrosine-type recombinase/integrase [Planctomycetaceae bacterium]
MRKPFYVKSRNTWYCWHNGRQIKLSKCEAEAYKIWLSLSNASFDANRSLSELIDSFLAHLDRRLERQEFTAEYASTFKYHLVNFSAVVGEQKIGQLRRHHLTEYLAANQFTPSQEHRIITAVKSCLNWAVAEELVNRNPFAKYPRPKIKPRTKLITPEERAALMTARDEGNNDQRRAASFRPPLIALRHSGRRLGEICNLNVDDVSGATWTIHKHKTRRTTGKPQTAFTTPCLQTLTKILTANRSRGPVFKNSQGQRWKPNAVQLRFKRLRQRLGLPDSVTAHAYRHTYITDSIKNGVDMNTVAELVGHANAKMINEMYAHLGQDRKHLAQAAAKSIF